MVGDQHCCLARAFWGQWLRRKGTAEKELTKSCGGWQCLRGHTTRRAAPQPCGGRAGHGLEKTVELVEAGKVWPVQGSKAYGRATIAKCVEIDVPKLLAQRGEHKVEEEPLPYKHTYALWLRDVRVLRQPVVFAELRGVLGGPVSGTLCGSSSANRQSVPPRQRGRSRWKGAPRGQKQARSARWGWRALGTPAMSTAFCTCSFIQSACVLCYSLTWRRRSVRKHVLHACCGRRMRHTECGWRSPCPVEAISVKSWLGRWRTRKRRRLCFDRVHRGIGDIVGKKAERE